MVFGDCFKILIRNNMKEGKLKVIHVVVLDYNHKNTGSILFGAVMVAVLQGVSISLAVV